MSKKNRYERNARKRGFLGAIATTQDTAVKGDIKSTSIQTLKDAAGGVAGGFVGAALGRLSFFAGLIITAIGNFFKNKAATSLGIGMMTSSGIAIGQSAFGATEKKGVFEEAKDRLMNFKNIMAQKLFLDKLPFGKKATNQTTAGLGEVQYFTPPAENLLGDPSAEDKILQQLEQQITESGRMQVLKQGIQGFGNSEFDSSNQITGQTDGLNGELDPSKNY